MKLPNSKALDRNVASSTAVETGRSVAEEERRLNGTARCPSCGAEGVLDQVGSASGRNHYRCPKCGPWREKNPAAVALGRLGGLAAQAKLTAEERSKRSEDIANARWHREKLSRNIR